MQSRHLGPSIRKAETLFKLTTDCSPGRHPAAARSSKERTNRSSRGGPRAVRFSTCDRVVSAHAGNVTPGGRPPARRRQTDRPRPWWGGLGARRSGTKIGGGTPPRRAISQRRAAARSPNWRIFSSGTADRRSGSRQPEHCPDLDASDASRPRSTDRSIDPAARRRRAPRDDVRTTALLCIATQGSEPNNPVTAAAAPGV